MRSNTLEHSKSRDVTTSKSSPTIFSLLGSIISHSLNLLSCLKSENASFSAQSVCQKKSGVGFNNASSWD
jgi:hypothetical protein